MLLCLVPPPRVWCMEEGTLKSQEDSWSRWFSAMATAIAGAKAPEANLATPTPSMAAIYVDSEPEDTN